MPRDGPLAPTYPVAHESTPVSPLARDIVIVLVVKAIVLTLIWFAFFRAPVAPHMTMDPAHVAERIVSPGTNPEPPHAIR